MDPTEREVSYRAQGSVMTADANELERLVRKIPWVPLLVEAIHGSIGT